MRERRLAIFVWVLAFLFSMSLNAGDLFDLEGGSEEEKEETKEEVKDEGDEEQKKESTAPKTASLSEKDVKVDPKKEEKMRSLNINEKKKIKVVQKKYVEKDGRFEIGAGVGFINGDWDNVIAGSAHVTYHITEHFALKGRFLYGAVATERETREQVEEVDAAISSSNMKLAGGLSVLMTPFYGKLSLFGNYTPKFDVNVALGGYYYQVEQEMGKETEDKGNFAVNAGLGFKLFLTKNFAVDFLCDWFAMQDERKKSGGEAKRSYLKTDLLFTVNFSMLLPFE